VQGRTSLTVMTKGSESSALRLPAQQPACGSVGQLLMAVLGHLGSTGSRSLQERIRE
jgi:hypothetical protein